MQLRRDKGIIYDGKQPIILAGGHYYLFKSDARGDYRLRASDGSVPFPWYPQGSEPCAGRNNTSQAFIENWQLPADMLQALKSQRNNLVRIFLTNSFTPTDHFPYTPTSDGRLAIEDAVELGHWDSYFFGLLLGIARIADSLGIARGPTRLGTRNARSISRRVGGPRTSSATPATPRGAATTSWTRRTPT